MLHAVYTDGMGRCARRPNALTMDGSTIPTGRKKLVPALSRETKCPHEYDDDQELCLEVECGGCPGAQDLTNNRCLTGILQILSSEAKPETVILKRHIHRRYRESRLSVVFTAASGLAAMNRALSTRWEPSDRRCLTCEASIPRLVARIRQELLECPVEFMDNRPAVIARILAELEDIDCPRLHDCVDRSVKTGPDQGRTR